MTLVHDYVIVFGGREEVPHEFNDLYLLNLKELTWLNINI